MQRSLPRAILRTVAFLLLTGVVIPLFLAVGPLGPGPRHALRRFWSRATCLIVGLKLRRTGTPFRACPTLFVPNHSSYLDILVLGSFLDATFIAKSEVSGWPFFGFVAKLVGTMFVRRHWRQAKIQRDALAARLREGDSFILFGEGTSTSGLDVKPFKTSLLSVAEPWVMNRPVAVQPVTLVYLRLTDGTPIDANNNTLYAWWGDAELGPHLWQMMQLPGVVIEIHFGQAVLSWSVTSRKILGRELRHTVRHTLHDRRGWDDPDLLDSDGIGDDAAPALG